MFKSLKFLKGEKGRRKKLKLVKIVKNKFFYFFLFLFRVSFLNQKHTFFVVVVVVSPHHRSFLQYNNGYKVVEIQFHAQTHTQKKKTSHTQKLKEE